MGWYAYCVATPTPRQPAEVEGLEDGRVEVRTLGRISCWISRLEARPAPSVERIRRHNAVVESAAATGETPLPLRFGQWFASLDALDEAFLEREDDFARSLAHVAGCAEFGVQVLDPALQRPSESAGPSGGGGREYLRLLAQRQAAERATEARGLELATRIRAQVGVALRDERIEPLQTAHGVVRLVHLVRHADADDYRQGLDEVRRGLPELRFLVSGPWPPYSFVA